MVTLSTILSLLSPFLAGGIIFQFIFYKSQKKKFVAGTNQEIAKADGLNLGNIQKYIELQDSIILKISQERDSFAQENTSIKSKINEYDYKFSDMERKVRGMQNVINNELTKRQYAERHICLNLPCSSRIPVLGTYKKDEV
ncbi:MAG: hypothetical protein WC833_08620 [Bacteroidales bacterium]|jgi:peptidoglycan hydrolase CwlO-like protein